MPDLFSALPTGARVVVRHRLPDGAVTDALGDFLGVVGGEGPGTGPRRVRLLTRHGEVEVQTATITHAKPVPPAPPRRRPRRAGEATD